MNYTYHHLVDATNDNRRKTELFNQGERIKMDITKKQLNILSGEDTESTCFLECPYKDLFKSAVILMPSEVRRTFAEQWGEMEEVVDMVEEVEREEREEREENDTREPDTDNEGEEDDDDDDDEVEDEGEDKNPKRNVNSQLDGITIGEFRERVKVVPVSEGSSEEEDEDEDEDDGTDASPEARVLRDPTDYEELKAYLKTLTEEQRIKHRNLETLRNTANGYSPDYKMEKIYKAIKELNDEENAN